MDKSNVVDLKMKCGKCHSSVRLALDGVGDKLRVVRCEGCGAIIVLEPDFVPLRSVPAASAKERLGSTWRDRRLAA